MNGSTQPLNVDSNVRGADVLVNGTLVGQTPFSGEIKRAKNITLLVRKDGYEAATLNLEGSIVSSFWGNIIAGGGLGSTTDFATGSMYQIAPHSYNVDLRRAGE